ncbi:MAG: serine/threonine protein kinase, partial [Clostridia bacterium]|nr:serine/threonine protein kinase [Clostridia bacterium]
MDYCPHCMTPTTGQNCPACGKSTQWQAPTSQLPVGTLLRSSSGHVYQLGAAKGQGGFGITYAAMDLRNNTRVAVKEYFPSHCAGRDTMTRVICATGKQEPFGNGLRSFLQEAKTLSSVGALDSVVSVRDFFESNGTAYIVMEYVDGSGLNDVVAKRGPMHKQMLFPILQPLLRDLAILHRAGVIHRDISPDNLILTKEGKLKLLDFGAARSTSGGKDMTVMLKAGFSPLEQYQSKGQGPYTDVYAMAGTIYYCLTGRVPPASVDRIGQDELRMPNDFGAGLTQKEQDALVWGLSVHAQHRPQNVEAFANALLSDQGSLVFEPPVRGEPQVTYPQPSYAQSGYPQNQPQGMYTQSQPQGVYTQNQPQPSRKGGFGKGLAIGITAAVAAVALLIAGLAIGGAFGGKKSGKERDDDDDVQIRVTEPAATRPVMTVPATTEPAVARDLLRTDDGFLYYIENGEAVIAGFDSDDTFLSFPDELDGFTVAVLDAGCLEGNTTVQTILLPMNCRVIRADAFSGCTGLRQMYCYSSISVDPSALTGC